MMILKEAISAQHARMEALPFITALNAGELPIESYVGQLRAMAVIQGTLEHELSLTDSGEIRTLFLGRPSRLVHLRQDLSLFDPLLIGDSEAALEQTRKIAERIRRYRVEQPTDLLGILYVLEGTTLGNAVHLPDVLKIFGAQTGGTAHYYTGYGDRTSEFWKAFSRAMNDFPLAAGDAQRLTQVALDFFDQLELLFTALYPLDPAKIVTSAGMLNPEAGDHAVPADARELAAAVSAAKRCRQEFPYFDERYQDRGRSFAKSDAAWLVTLAGLSSVQRLSQVDWLGRVLGNRGMPRITLERQLELLYAELVAAVPTRKAEYEGLFEAAQRLKTERLQAIPEAIFTVLAQEFAVRTDDELSGRFRNTGRLIVAAVCDDVAGVTGAVSSLLSWLTDAERFTPQWITAVENTLQQARKKVQAAKK
jgi:heme oxygenase